MTKVLPGHSTDDLETSRMVSSLPQLELESSEFDSYLGPFRDEDKATIVLAYRSGQVLPLYIVDYVL